MVEEKWIVYAFLSSTDVCGDSNAYKRDGDVYDLSIHMPVGFTLVKSIVDDFSMRRGIIRGEARRQRAAEVPSNMTRHVDSVAVEVPSNMMRRVLYEARRQRSC
ncbi:hypothetical protein LXG23DRAFT_34655 [Yarrowia lipolytica]|nr:hypothetical protein LXG23DRAFT_34655 [Yarrowia lipolytica]